MCTASLITPTAAILGKKRSDKDKNSGAEAGNASRSQAKATAGALRSKKTGSARKKNLQQFSANVTSGGKKRADKLKTSSTTNVGA
jgi:hypothetical protein